MDRCAVLFVGDMELKLEIMIVAHSNFYAILAKVVARSDVWSWAHVAVHLSGVFHWMRAAM